MVARHREIIVESSRSPRRIDAYLAEVYARDGNVISRALVQGWIREGRVTCDGKPVRPSTRVHAGMLVSVDPGPPPPSDADPDPSVTVDILFEDNHLLVVNKPAGLVVHPARGHHTGTLVNGLLALGSFSPEVVQQAARDGATFRPGIVHRLDKDTSGVLVVAKTVAAREGLKALFATHDIERAYRAVVVGEAHDATYDTPHARHPKSRLKFTSLRGEPTRRAITMVKLQQKLACGRASVVECRLQTGRTHQIRVHLAEQAKTPVLGDAMYGPKPSDPEIAAIAGALGRHWLHAYLLGFVHPVTGCTVRFEAPIPDELRAALDALIAL